VYQNPGDGSRGSRCCVRLRRLWRLAVGSGRCPGLLRRVSRCTPVAVTVDGLGPRQRRGRCGTAKRIAVMERDAALPLKPLLILPLILCLFREPPFHRGSDRIRAGPVAATSPLTVTVGSRQGPLTADRVNSVSEATEGKNPAVQNQEDREPWPQYSPALAPRCLPRNRNSLHPNPRSEKAPETAYDWF